MTRFPLTVPARRRLALAVLATLATLAFADGARAANPQPGPPLAIQRAAGPITLDGDLSDAGWQGVTPITNWFETHVGDNVEPQVKNVAYLTYDDHYLYAGFRFEDPNPRAIRAPLGDHDAVPSSTDYAGVIVDCRNDGKTARMFLANPHGVQYDALTSDVTGEDSSPDFYWDAVGKVTDTGWNLELRIPFSSLRYTNTAAPTMGVLLYRNYPRDRRYQFFSARLPRDVSCFVCNSSKLTGLADLPHGSHLVVAPFTTAAQNAVPRGATLGNGLNAGDVKSDGGVDVKWNPLADAALDATVRPDFSQVESDAAQITANERFALSYPEKRSFFLEGVDLLSTPFTAVYTRTITSPSAGLRATGRFGTTAYSALVTRDRGGGLAIIPGSQGSEYALQDFRSDAAVVRVRHDIGNSFVSVLATDREIDGGAYNRVFGPDFQWRPNSADNVTGQALWSASHTPRRPDLASEWDGRALSDRGLVLNASHNTAHVDLFAQGMDLGPNFRADDGFIPQVGYREMYWQSGYTVRPPKQFLSRVRFFTVDYWDVTPDGAPLNRRLSVGSGMDGRLNSFFRVELNLDDIRDGSVVLSRFRPHLHVETSPGRVVNAIVLDADVGQELDFDNVRKGTGTTLAAAVTVRPSERLELRDDASARWLWVDAGARSGRLFLQQIERLRATWSFSSRAFVRLIGQYEQTRSNPDLYTFAVDPKDADFGGSALFSYKLNWQTVLFTGYGDERTFTPVTNHLVKSGRQIFAKVSYALQR